MKYLVTGSAGFIGFHLVNRLIADGHEVVGIDNLNDYYPVSLKYARLQEAGISEQLIVQGHEVFSTRLQGYRFLRMDLVDRSSLEQLCQREKFDVIVNLAAQAGVRYSIENPYAYVQSNLVGFINLIECARQYGVKHFVYASSSSVYGGNKKTPFSETDRVDKQVSIYAATKKSNELMANVYSHLYGLPTTGLRFFTVYGPWGRPDMAPILFSRAILQGEPIKVFNHGNLSRDFTYVADIIEGVVRICYDKSKWDQTKDTADESLAKVYNIGCGHPVPLMDFIHTLEKALGQEAQMKFLPMQPGDVYTTYADTSKLAADYGYAPQTTLQEGISHFAAWYKSWITSH